MDNNNTAVGSSSMDMARAEEVMAEVDTALMDLGTGRRDDMEAMGGVELGKGYVRDYWLRRLVVAVWIF